MAVVTVSRQYGAGGKSLGEKVAKKLGYAMVNEDIIQMVADKTNVSKGWVESIEKEAGGKLLKFMSSLISVSYIERILGSDKGYIDEQIYVNTLHEVIRQIAGEGNVVIIGRGGQYILQDHPEAFHVLLVADKSDRIRFMEKHYRLSNAEATRVVEVQGKRRANLYKKFGQQNYDSPALYHAVFNMSRMDMDQAAEVICGMVTDLTSRPQGSKAP